MREGGEKELPEKVNHAKDVCTIHQHKKPIPATLFVSASLVPFPKSVETENQDLELHLSSLGAINTMFAAIFSKLGVPIKTIISATMLEEAINGAIPSLVFSLVKTVSRKGLKGMCSFLFD